MPRLGCDWIWFGIPTSTREPPLTLAMQISYEISHSAMRFRGFCPYHMYRRAKGRSLLRARLQASTTNQSINQINLHWKSSTSESHVTLRCSESWTYQNGDLLDLITNNHHKLNPFKSKPSNPIINNKDYFYIL